MPHAAGPSATGVQYAQSNSAEIVYLLSDSLADSQTCSTLRRRRISASPISRELGCTNPAASRRRSQFNTRTVPASSISTIATASALPTPAKMRLPSRW